MRFKSVEEAKRHGIKLPEGAFKAKSKTKKKKNKRKKIAELIQNIRSSSYEFKIGNNGEVILTIDGFAAPSWNKMIRMDRRFYSSYSNALKAMVIDAGLRAKVLKKYKKFNSKEPVYVNIHCERRDLLDLDNVCAKQLIDGIVACGIIVDDNPCYMQKYQATQTKAKKDRTIITITKL